MEIRTFLQTAMNISNPALLDMLEQVARIRCMNKGEITLKIGERQTKIYLLISGIMRCFFVDGANQEHTDCFIVEPGYPVMTASLSEPSLITAEAVVRTELLEIPVEAVFSLMNQHTELLWAYNTMLQKALFFHWQIKTSRFVYNAYERYIWFCQKWPEVEKNASSRYIASFLGMTPETLSRVRCRAKENDTVVDMLYDPNSEWNSTRIEFLLNHNAKQTGKRHGE